MKYAKFLCVVVVAVASLSFTIGPAYISASNNNSVVYSPMSNAFVSESVGVINQ